MNTISEDVNEKFTRHVKNFTLPHLSNVRHLAAPICELLGINFFCFHRLYENGNLLLLHTHQLWIEHFASQNYFPQLSKSLFLFAQSQQDLKFIFWDHWVTDSKQYQKFYEMRSIAINDFSIGNGLMLLRKGKNYTDFFDFADSPDSRDTFNIYMRHFASIEKYCHHFSQFISENFKEDMERLIQLDRHMLKKEFPKESNSTARFHSAMQENFGFQETNIATLSKRQRDIAKRLLFGKSMKSIAQELNLSPRTVETYAQIIRDKLQCTSKEQLQSKLMKADEFRELNYL